MFTQRPIAGIGVGLRPSHLDSLLQTPDSINWLELLTDNYLTAGVPILPKLERLREDYPFAMHSVGMSVGGSDDLNEAYLARIKSLADRLQPAIISDHLCWVAHGDRVFHELLPLPYTEEAVKHTAQRISQIQEQLGRTILIENVSSYLTYQQQDMQEWEFIFEVAEQADCAILLDINNVYVSSQNHGFDPLTYLNSLPPSRVHQFHLAGFADVGTHLLDTHGHAVHPPVWQLYRYCCQKFGPVPTLIEWDNDIPDFSTLASEAVKCKAYQQESAHAASAITTADQ